MVSLGPISTKRYCSYRCPFCYVESTNFVKYINWPVANTLRWARDNKEHFDIIYVSGDTESFAAPRTEDGLTLLEGLGELDVDLLFTTRFVFQSSEHWERLAGVAALVRSHKKLPISCVSICQFTVPELEPKPIAPPEFRADQLTRLLEAGWIPVLSMRPIFPSVPSSDFEHLLRSVAPNTKNALIAPYYFDPSSPQLSPMQPGRDIGVLSFDIGSYSGWQEIRPSEEVVDKIMAISKDLGIAVYWNSRDLYVTLRQES